MISHVGNSTIQVTGRVEMFSIVQDARAGKQWRQQLCYRVWGLITHFLQIPASCPLSQTTDNFLPMHACKVMNTKLVPLDHFRYLLETFLHHNQKLKVFSFYYQGIKDIVSFIQHVDQTASILQIYTYSNN